MLFQLKMSLQYAHKNTRNLSQKQHYTDIQVDVFLGIQIFTN